MHIKRFTAPTLKAAMNAVKAEFGTDALILNTKRLTTEPGRPFEVVAAVDFDIEKLNIPSGPAVKTARAETPADLISGAELTRLISREFGELKELCMTMVTASDTPVSGVIRTLEKEMLVNGIDPRLVKRILAKVCAGSKGEKTQNLMKSRLKRLLAEAIKVSDPLEGNRLTAFIGPPGVGKTTTIAKLAAIHTLKKKRRAALLTMDNFRIAATEQLKVYARIIGIPVGVASTPAELGALIREHSDKDLILIDTAGRGSNDSGHFKQLRKLADIEPEIKFNLVLNSQVRDDSLAGSLMAYKGIPVDSLTFTKLDEGYVYGQMLNAMMSAGKPVAYITAGQRVPEDIEVATKERLLNFFLPN
jgi:flagellar biosynthesis protein FlhF